MLRVYNTLTGEKEEFKTLEPNRVKMYVCGLTVQNYSHLGHIRSAINYDVIRRYLEYKGYDVTYIMNFTDINEKIVTRAVEEGLTTAALAEKYAAAYEEDIAELNVKRPTAFVRATQNIDAIIEVIARLIEGGFAYEVNGNVYFDIAKFAEYGKLSGRNLEEMEAGARIEINEEKRNPMDFALWKQAPEGEVSWESPWGKGWPGWHIECSAMSMKYLGETFDIHGGGSDLIFPHHENEIAQSEACTGKTFARYWLHNGTVNLKGEKMSKSVGNFFTTRELLERFAPDEIRYYLLTKHYRTPIDFGLDELEKVKTSLGRLKNTFRNVNRILNGQIEKDDTSTVEIDLDKFDDDFTTAMDDDFNSALAIGVIHELARKMNSIINEPDFRLSETNHAPLLKAFKLFQELNQILGIELNPEEQKEGDQHLVEDLIDLALDLREEARQNKDWELADRIRDRLEDLDLIVKDTPQGVVWERKSE